MVCARAVAMVLTVIADMVAMVPIVPTVIAAWFRTWIEVGKSSGLCLPLVPYWGLIMTALVLSPFTVLLPQWIKGSLTLPSKKDFPDEWFIYGKKYNLKAFYDIHPGGNFALRSAKGSECTGLFESCHTFISRDVLLKMLSRYEIKDADPKGIPQPEIEYSDPFYEDLKKMVREHFRGTPKGSHKMATPELCIHFCTLALYWAFIYHMVVNGSFWCFPIVGYLSWQMTAHLMHDGSHNALFSAPWANRLFAHAAFPYGVNVTGWQIEHVMSHHIYTNEDEKDVDLYHFDPIMALVNGHDKLQYNLLHYLRLIVLFSSAIPHLGVVVPYGLLFGQVDPAHGHAMYDRVKAIDAHRAELRQPMVKEMAAQVVFWIFHAYMQGVPMALAANLSTYAIASYLFSFFTQVSHLQAECFQEPGDGNDLSFAKRQVASSMDFASSSYFWGHVSGGLNVQAFHHCFPSVSAMHLRYMYPKFRRVCKEHGVELKESSSMSAFLMGFINYSN